MANNWYITITMADGSEVCKTAIDFILEHWDSISRSKEKPVQGIAEVYIPTKCCDIAKEFLDNLAKTGDGIKMQFASESSMCEDVSVSMSKDGKWNNLGEQQ